MQTKYKGKGIFVFTNNVFTSQIRTLLTSSSLVSDFSLTYRKNTPMDDLDQKYRKGNALTHSMCDIQSFPSLSSVVFPHKQPLRCCEGHRWGFWFGTWPKATDMTDISGAQSENLVTEFISCMFYEPAPHRSCITPAQRHIVLCGSCFFCGC